MSALGFQYCFGHVHPYFGYGIVGYTVGSILSAYAFKLNVDHQLAFEYGVTVVVEGTGFTTNTLVQAFLISYADIDPVIAFGISNAASNLMKVIVYLYYSWKSDKDYECDISLSLKAVTENDEQVYLYSGTLTFAGNLAFNTLLVDFFDQLYFIIFVQDQRVIGQLTLIRSFGNLMIRFLYGPVGDVTYNLYSKMISEMRMDSSNIKSRHKIATKMISILQSCLSLFAFLNYFIFCYSYGTASVILRWCFGDQWVTEVASD